MSYSAESRYCNLDKIAKVWGARVGHAGEMSYLWVHQARAATHTTKAATMLDTTTTTKQ